MKAVVSATPSNLCNDSASKSKYLHVYVYIHIYIYISRFNYTHILFNISYMYKGSL